MKRILTLCLWLLTGVTSGQELEQNFRTPPASARPWVYWFWINGNVSKTGITNDLEALKRVGVGGVLWMEVSGMMWAPEGPVSPGSPQWQDCMQWAIRECARLGLEFDLSVDFGYGSGGPHITPDLSMQKLYWSEIEVEGGQSVSVMVPRPEVKKEISAWLRPGAAISPQVLEQIDKVDSYRDIAVLAIPAPTSLRGKAYRIPQLSLKDGTHDGTPQGEKPVPVPADAIIPADQVVDLTAKIDRDGKLDWAAPPGKWLILRGGHASNFKMTRPCPALAVGLECNRLAKAGIETHYNAFLKKIFDGAGSASGTALNYVHIDSWEAGGQNWTATFPAEFRQRRGYDLRSWLPVLAGRVIGNRELSERFLWDIRTTVSEMIRDNYAGRLRELAQPHKIRLSIEAYGHLCIDNLAYAGISDMPISEFWARGDGLFPTAGSFEASTKAMASAAHTGGKPIIAAEAFTSDRGWRDHPYLLKGMGDGKFCEGLNRMIFHLSAHQAYENMIPGLTHRKWSEHFQRFNTWWDYSRPWLEYLARCQYVLQQGDFVADICWWMGEGAPVTVNAMKANLPPGYDVDFCSSDTVLQMTVRNGRLVLPSGMSYRYLQLPATDRMTPPLARKIRDLIAAGACVIGENRLKGAPGLTDYPNCDAEVQKIGGSLKLVANLNEALARDKLAPDFEAADLKYIHRRTGDVDIYFVSHQQPVPHDATCIFRVAGKTAELWNPETGMISEPSEFMEKDGRTSVRLHFDPLQSWFVVFRPKAETPRPKTDFGVDSRVVQTISSPWQVSFDPKWGGPQKPVQFTQLNDWSKHSESGVKYYSGTATYRTRFKLDTTGDVLDLGAVEVMARVKLNGHECGIAWKPPYRVGISKAVRAGENELEIDVVNLWINRLIGDEQLPLDSKWKDSETLLEWPEWFKTGQPRPSGRYTFTSSRPYKKDTPLVSSGLLGPVTIQARDRASP